LPGGRGLEVVEHRRPVVHLQSHAWRAALNWAAGVSATIGLMRYNALTQVLTAKKTTHGGADLRAAVRRASSGLESPRRIKRARPCAEWPPGWDDRVWQRMVDPGLEVTFVRIFDRVWAVPGTKVGGVGGELCGLLYPVVLLSPLLAPSQTTFSCCCPVLCPTTALLPASCVPLRLCADQIPTRLLVTTLGSPDFNLPAKPGLSCSLAEFAYPPDTRPAQGASSTTQQAATFRRNSDL
jgi:hypothetical protein